MKHYQNKHYRYHGAVVTVWKSKARVSLVMFVFVTAERFFTEKWENNLGEYVTGEKSIGNLVIE